MDQWQGPYAGLNELLELWAMSVMVAGAATVAIAVIARTLSRRAASWEDGSVVSSLQAVKRQAALAVAGYRRRVRPPSLRPTWTRRQSSHRRPDVSTAGPTPP